MGKTFGTLKRPGKGAVPTLWCKQSTVATTRTTTTTTAAAAENEAANSWKKTNIDTSAENDAAN